MKTHGKVTKCDAEQKKETVVICNYCLKIRYMGKYDSQQCQLELKVFLNFIVILFCYLQLSHCCEQLYVF